MSDFLSLALSDRWLPVPPLGALERYKGAEPWVVLVLRWVTSPICLNFSTSSVLVPLPSSSPTIRGWYCLWSCGGSSSFSCFLLPSFGFPFILTVASFFSLLWPECISLSRFMLWSLIGSSCVHLCHHDSRVGHISQAGCQDVASSSHLALSRFFPSGSFTGEGLNSSVVLSTGVY